MRFSAREAVDDSLPLVVFFFLSFISLFRLAVEFIGLWSVMFKADALVVLFAFNKSETVELPIGSVSFRCMLMLLRVLLLCDGGDDLERDERAAAVAAVTVDAAVS